MKQVMFFSLLTVAAFGQQQALETRDEHYRLQQEDKIEVLYRYTPEYNATVALQPDGYVSLPLIGEVKVLGMTLEQATAVVKEIA